MRVYVSSSVGRLMSTGALVVSLGLLGLVVWKAATLWQADPTLRQIQQLLNREGETP
ncbi:MAG: hypothetical protein ACFCVD_18175 [Nodosilinea sp.]